MMNDSRRFCLMLCDVMNYDDALSAADSYESVKIVKNCSLKMFGLKTFCSFLACQPCSICRTLQEMFNVQASRNVLKLGYTDIFSIRISDKTLEKCFVDCARE